MGDWGADVVRFTIPLLFTQEHPNVFQEVFVNVARRLKAMHGLGGHGFVLSPTRESENHPIEAFFADKMHGIDAGNPLELGVEAKTGIKSVSWLTAIGTDLLDKLGASTVFAAICRHRGAPVTTMVPA